MVTKRIIPCLDIKEKVVVKGVNFKSPDYAGEAIDLSLKYYEEYADELVFLDITATEEKRKTLIELVKEIAKVIRIPFTVGGGISSLENIHELIFAGADKVSLNTIAVQNKSIITETAKKFGSQAIVAAVDINLVNDKYEVFIKAGKEATGLDGIEWCKELQDLGAGELLITSMNKDGTKSGFDLEFLSKVEKNVSIPIIASGGAGKKEDFRDLFFDTGISAGLAASLFHYNILPIPELKKYLSENGIKVRL